MKPLGRSSCTAMALFCYTALKKTETKENYTTIFWTNLLCDDEIELCSKHK